MGPVRELTVITIVVVVVVVAVVIVVVMVAFKCAIRDFLQSHSAANRLQHVRSSGPDAIVSKSRATHRALITCNMPCYVPRNIKHVYRVP